jgi:hypothetical protein
LRRGIILKCQGNPVSCYGKRSSQINEEQLQQQQQQQQDFDSQSLMGEEEIESLNQEKQELVYERQLEKMIRNCKLGIQKACSAILKIMLMNSSK